MTQSYGNMFSLIFSSFQLVIQFQMSDINEKASALNLPGLMQAMYTEDKTMYSAVSKNNITTKTRKGCHDANKRLVFWLYENNREGLHQDGVTMLVQE